LFEPFENCVLRAAQTWLKILPANSKANSFYSFKSVRNCCEMNQEHMRKNSCLCLTMLTRAGICENSSGIFSSGRASSMTMFLTGLSSSTRRASSLSGPKV
jgi:hypothetical protein